MRLLKTGERLLPNEYKSKEDYIIYLRHIFAYEFALKHIKKNSYGLDIGSGEGYGTKFLSKKVRKIVGVDIDPNTVSHANNEHRNPNLEFLYYDGGIVPFEDNIFDFVVSFQVIEHVKDVEKYVSEAFRVLKKGGIFMLTTPNKVNRLKPGQKPWNKYHLREYSSQELQEVLSRNFKDIQLFGIFGSGEVNLIEMKRIQRNQKLVSLDPLNLRYYIPEVLKVILLKLIRRESKSRNNTMEFSIDNFFTDIKSLDKSLDLLALCRK